MNDIKKRAVVSYETMSKELSAAFEAKYPKGYSDYSADVIKYDKPDGTYFHAVTIEIPDAIYLVKVKVKTDDAEDIERWLDENDRDDDDTRVGDAGEGDDLPDNDISQYDDSLDD